MQGTYECFAEIARRALRRLAGRDDHAHRRPRRDGRRAAAGGDDERRRRAVRRGRPRADRAPASRRATSTRSADDLDDAVARCRARAKASGARSASGSSATPPTCCRALLDARLRGRHRHRPDERARPARRLRPGPADARARPTRCARDDPDEYVAPLARGDGRALRGDGRLPATRGAEVFDYGNSLRAEARARRLRARVRLPRLRARLHPPAVLRGQGPVPLGRAVGRPGRHRRDRPRGARGVPRRRARSRAGSAQAGERIAFQGLPARICWLGYGERHRLGLRFNEMVRSGELSGADRDRPRPPRLRLGRLARTARPRAMADESDAIADWPLLERAGQHRGRRVVGVDPPRRRRRHRALDPRRHGVRRRRHRARRAEARARAHRRPGHGRDPPRRRGLRRGRSRSPRSAACGSRCARSG